MNTPQNHQNSLTIVILVALIAGIIGFGLGYMLAMGNDSGSQTISNQNGACTEEAFICEDGSTVVRVGPECNFQECP